MAYGEQMRHVGGVVDDTVRSLANGLPFMDRIAAAGGAFAFEDEVDPAKFVRGVTTGATGLVVRSGHDEPPVLVPCERGPGLRRPRS